jgi:hypothetical protein
MSNTNSNEVTNVDLSEGGKVTTYLGVRDH